MSSAAPTHASSGYQSTDNDDILPTRIPTNVLGSGNHKSQSPPRRGLRALDKNFGHCEEDSPKESIVLAMDDLFDDSPSRSSIISRGAHDDDGNTPSTQAQTEPEIYENLWDGYDAPREDPARVRIVDKEEERWDCPEHGGSMCSPGICETRALVVRERRWEKEAEERERDKVIRMEKALRRERKKSAQREDSVRSESRNKSESPDESESPRPMKEEGISGINSVRSASDNSGTED
ncbi:hypothetical protein BGW80DRAFT_1293393, partial [Lactifluus volemus]